jgi:diaminohydroxyphosphoribosylaminopyrimidine deaminase/5-amino-6-(5-phosphoribosylamino)uracil reductase
LLDVDLVDAVVLITTPGSIGEAGLLASPDGPIADLLAAAGLVELEQQRLGPDTLVRYGRPSAPV